MKIMSTLYFETPLTAKSCPPSKIFFCHTVLNYFLGKVTNAQLGSSKIKCVRAKNRRGGGGVFKAPHPGSYRVNETSVNHVFYADDLCIMLASPAGLQKLIDI